jgi:hypothetical protein
VDFERSPAFARLERNAARFGFTLSTPRKPPRHRARAVALVLASQSALALTSQLGTATQCTSAPMRRKGHSRDHP